MIFFQSEATAARRRVWVYLVDGTDGITPETGEAAGQPQVSKNGGAWVNTTATLTAVGNGTYYVELTAVELDTLGKVMVRYDSAATAEFSVVADVIAANIFDAVRLGLTALPNAAAEAAGGLYTRGTGAGQINQPANGLVDVNVENWNTTAVPAEHTAGYPIVTIKDGTGTGEINTNLGAVALVDLVTTLTTYTGNTVQTGDSFVRLGAPAGVSVSADILVIDNLVDDLESRVGTPSNLGGGATLAFNLSDIEAQTDDIGVAGAGLTAVPWNAAWDAEVQSEVDDALVVQRLDELVNADSDIDGLAPPTVGSVFHELMTKTAASFTYDQATDSLEAIRDRGDAAWTTATGFSTHSAADVWTSATRTLTAATNITSTGGTITVAAGAVTVGTNNDKTGYALTAAERNSIADAYLDRADGVETGFTPRAATRYIAAACAGRVSGAGTATETFLGLDEATTRLTITVDASGNRTDVVYG